MFDQAEEAAGSGQRRDDDLLTGQSQIAHVFDLHQGDDCALVQYSCKRAKTNYDVLQVELLASARSKLTKHDHPMALVHTYGKGRVFLTPLGHDAKALRVAGTAELIRRATAWVAGREPVVLKKNAGLRPEGGERN
jgi:hypothetical protein